VVIQVPHGWQANRGALTQQYLGAAAVAVASLDSMPEDVRNALSEPAVTLKSEIDQAQQQLPPVPAFFYSTNAMAAAMLGAPISTLKPGAVGKTATGSFTFAVTPAAGARNVVAIVPGSDAKLRGEYVAIGAHSDHVGFSEPVDHDSLYAFYHVVRPEGADDGEKPAAAEDWPKVRAMLDSLRKAHAARQDSIFNGADDDGSGSMGVLEIAEAVSSALLTTPPEGEIVITGSLYFVGAARGILVDD
jgi:hypothetical protein